MREKRPRYGSTGDTCFEVVSFNVHHGGLQRDKRTPYDVDSALATLGGDIVVLQEHVRERPVQVSFAAGFDHHHGVWVDEDRSLGLRVATHLPVLEQRTLRVKTHGNDPRSDSIAVRVKIGSAEAWVVGVHITTGWLPLGSALQVRELSTQLPDGPLIVLGDHNLWGPAAAAAGFARIGLERAVRGRTWPARFPHSQIDHIWYRELELVDASISDNLGSDHLAVRACFRPLG